jgi:predicted GNAT family N-acyltransferase
MNGEGFSVRLADWQRDVQSLSAIRRQVFVIEQAVPAELEWDGIDESCRHAIAETAAQAPVGCGRLLPDGHIGRMAVLAAWRGRGVGGVILELLVECARDAGHPRALLNAQTRALPFYVRHGFVAFGPEFVEAGIAHRAMERRLV